MSDQQKVTKAILFEVNQKNEDTIVVDEKTSPEAPVSNALVTGKEALEQIEPSRITGTSTKRIYKREWQEFLDTSPVKINRLNRDDYGTHHIMIPIDIYSPFLSCAMQLKEQEKFKFTDTLGSITKLMFSEWSTLHGKEVKKIFQKLETLRNTPEGHALRKKLLSDKEPLYPELDNRKPQLVTIAKKQVWIPIHKTDLFPAIAMHCQALGIDLNELLIAILGGGLQRWPGITEHEIKELQPLYERLEVRLKERYSLICGD